MFFKHAISFLLSSLFTGYTFANSLVEDFSNTSKLESSTAVWNFERKEIHPSVLISGYRVLVTDSFIPEPVDIGDGSHGIFSPATYANFGSVVGSVITIDAATLPVIKVTRFHLESGYTLTSINGPLMIYSLGDVIIDGIINCSGYNGEAANLTLGGAGGQGRCGGGIGGSGGGISSSAQDGTPSSGPYLGGGGASYIGAAPGGGGGGGGSLSGNAGVAGQNSVPLVNTGGLAGTGTANHNFTNLSGGPGGGGGSGSNTEGGGGGGGGGGTVVIHSGGNILISASGFILALGGNGGMASSGGGGGGGGGGSVKIFTPNQLTLDTGVDVDVNGGLGAIPTLPNAGNGGDGSFGRTWLAPSIFAGTGFESHISNLDQIGAANYSTAAEIIISKSYDTNSTLTKYTSVLTSPVTPDAVLEVQGSADNFESDVSPWLPASQMSQLDTKRFIKFKLTLTNSNATNPTRITGITINFDPGIQNEFNFSGCGTLKNARPSNHLMIALTFLFLFLPVLLAQKLKMVKTSKKK